MSFAPISSDIDNFYNENEKFLKNQYPGIKVQRLVDEFLLFSKKVELDKNHSKYGQAENLNIFFEQLLNSVPLEYITGKAFFYKTEFFVNKNVLIPRSETEILVEKAVELIKLNNVKTIVDVGTGSGAIILSILSEISGPLNAFATDLSSRALEVAKRNYFLKKFKIPNETHLEFVHCDRLSSVEVAVDLIVSNPPYIRPNLDDTHEQVRSYEPEMALYINEQEYDKWFDEFFKQSYSCLKDGGHFLMEGNEHILCDQLKQAKAIGFSECKVLKDYTGRDRFLLAKKVI